MPGGKRMILSKESLQSMIEANEKLSLAKDDKSEFFDEAYLKDRVRLKVELGCFIGQRIGYLSGIETKTIVNDDESVVAGVRVIQRGLALIERVKESTKNGYKHSESNEYFDVENYCSYEHILSEYRELFRYHDTHLLAMVADMNSYRNLAGIIAGTLIILERIGVDHIELKETFIELNQRAVNAVVMK